MYLLCLFVLLEVADAVADAEAVAEAVAVSVDSKEEVVPIAAWKPSVDSECRVDRVAAKDR